MMKMIQNEINAHKKVVEKTMENLQSHIYTACIIASETIKNGNKILLFGNGESAANAQQIVANLNVKHKTERRGLPGIALTADTSVLTAIGNDYGYDRIFDRQIETLACDGDLLIGISTSGNSKNVLRALSLGRNMGFKTIGFSGRNGGAMNEFCDINLVVPSDDASRIQEIHIMIGHIICQAINDSLEQL